jgi:hypothetical protein
MIVVASTAKIDSIRLVWEYLTILQKAFFAQDDKLLRYYDYGLSWRCWTLTLLAENKYALPFFEIVSRAVVAGYSSSSLPFSLEGLFVVLM